MCSSEALVGIRDGKGMRVRRPNRDKQTWEDVLKSPLEQNKRNVRRNRPWC